MSVIDNALQTLFKLGIEVKKVWENASPNSSFAAQKINANIDGVTAILVEFKTSTSSSASKFCRIAMLGEYDWADLRREVLA